jgi:hypothetical protein
MVNPIEDIALLGRKSETLNILGKQVVMETLDDDDMVNAYASTSVFDTTTRAMAVKRTILARAIKSINGTTWNDLIKPEEKDSKNSILVAIDKIGTWQKTVVDVFYSKYVDLEMQSTQELDKIQAEILKNQTAGSSASSTSSTLK